MIVALSCTSRRYFRHDLWPDYKGHRAKTARPKALEAVHAHIEAHYDHRRGTNIEADDILGIMLTARVPGQRRICVTSDKDLRQIPGLHFNHNKMAEGVFEISREDGDAFHLYQTLVGDACDNYPGCPRIGPKRALQILKKPTWSAVVSAFVARGKTAADALVQARVARILRSGEYNKQTGEVKLWSPKKSTEK